MYLPKVDFRLLSSQKCAACKKRLKQNLVNKKGHRPDLVCFDCYRTIYADQNMRTAREIRRNPRLRSVKRQFIPLKNYSL